MPLFAVIILYEPSLDRLAQNIQAILPQVDHIVLVDNGSSNIGQTATAWGSLPQITLLQNESNLGIAAATNIGLAFALHHQATWALTLDQDSVCPPNLINSYRPYLNRCDVGILCPVICDRNRAASCEASAPETELSFCIASGALLRVDLWQRLGGQDEWMFIDLVDFEYCCRVRAAGYRILRINTVYLTHEVGQIREVVFGSHRVAVYNHAPLRRYYFARNWVYFYRRHKGRISLWQAVKAELVQLIKILLFERQKGAKLKAALRGICDGLSFHPPLWVPPGA